MADILQSVAGIWTKLLRDIGGGAHAEVVAAALERQERAVTATIPAGGALSEEIDVSGFAMGTLYMPAAWDAADIGYLSAPATGGTFLPLYDESGALVQVSGPAASKAYTLPARALAGGYIKLWSQTGAGVDVNQTAARAITLILKA